MLINELLLEGGNMVVIDKNGKPKLDDNGQITKAQKISIDTDVETSVNIIKFRTDLIELLTRINEKFTQSFKKPLWKEASIASGQIVSGSSNHIFDNNKLDIFVKAKKAMGDIDTMIPHEYLESLWKLLMKLQDRQLGKFQLLGCNKPQGLGGGHQINYLFKYHYIANNKERVSTNVQIDFEGQDFENGEPTEWATISHGSSFQDIEHGIKGVFCVYLWRAVTKVNTQIKNGVLLTNKSPLAPTQIKSKIKDVRIQQRGGEPVTDFSMGAISVDRGFRDKYQPQLDANGNPVEIDVSGSKAHAYKSIETSQSNYVKDIAKIRQKMYPQVQNADGDFRSFIQNCKWIKQYFHSDDAAKVFNIFLELCFSPKEGQELENPLNNPTAKDTDRTAKLAACNAFLKIVGPNLGPQRSLLQDKLSSMSSLGGVYYKSYGRRKHLSADEDTGIMESVINNKTVHRILIIMRDSKL